MKKYNKLEKYILIISFVLVILFPYLIFLFNQNVNVESQDKLSGSEEKVELSYENIDNYVLQNFPGREYLIKTKNQLLYSLFDISPNENITKVGDVLFSTETLNYYLHGLYQSKDEDIDLLVHKFKRFKDFCDEKNKKMVIILTPCKPRYYDGNYPISDDLIMLYDSPQNNYNVKKRIRDIDKLKIKLKENNINFFDSIEYIDNNKERIIEGVPPLFYNSGHHWSLYKGNLVGIAFHDYLRKTFGIKLPLLSVTASPSDVAMYPDSDLFDVLNIYDKPNEQFYVPVIKFENFDLEKLNFVVQGGSFLGSLLIPQITVTPFGDITHIENKSMFLNKYKDLVTFESYEEINSKYDMVGICKKADVFIFEIHELNVYNATFGFLDFLIDHMGEM